VNTRKVHPRTATFTVTKETTRMTLFDRFASFLNSFVAGEAVPDQAAQGRREGSVLRTRPTEDAEMRRVRGGRSAVRRLALLTALASFACLLAAGPAAAAQPWWHLNTSLRPSNLKPGGEGTIVLQALNVGDGCTAKSGPDGKTCTEDDEGIPSTLTATLPAGVSILGASFFEFPYQEGGFNIAGEPGVCEETAATVTCSTAVFEGFGVAPHGLQPYEFIEMRVEVREEGAAPGATYEATAAGGGASPVSATRPLQVGPADPAFGAEALSLTPEEEGGALDARAASHPFQLTNTFNLNQNALELNGQLGQFEEFLHPPALARNLDFKLPPGQLGNALAYPKCSLAQFSAKLSGGVNLCPDASSIGVAVITLDEPNLAHLLTLPVPLFNLEPARGEPARFGFLVSGAPIILDTSLRSGNGEDYGVTVATTNTTQIDNFIASTLTFWGTPGDPRHDASRGWGCIAGGHYNVGVPEPLPCNPTNPPKPPAFLTLPTGCAAPFATSVQGTSWPNQAFPSGATLAPLSYELQDEAGNPLGLLGCNQVPFAPQVHSEPTSNAATSPTGLNFDIDVNDEGLANSEGLAASQIKKAVVTLPQGFTTNPSVAEGLQACSQAQYLSESLNSEPGAGCPNASKVGDAEIESPLVEGKVTGSLFVATQGENPNGNLLTLYLVARNADLGVFVKQALKVTPDPTTGQLSTEVDNIPQLPFSHFRLSFRQGQRSPLITPPTCGNYTVKADLYPYSNPTVPLERESSFQITQGPEGGPCPNGVPPFHPNLEAGTTNNAAGTYSPFVTKITRKDSEQEITRFSIKLPPGVIGKLAGVSECSDAGVAAAKAREKEGGGALEEASPSCPKNSEIGHSLVGSGVGNVLAYAPGKLYLAGPYHGSPISIVSITAAKVGPFDLGTVVVRFALDIDHETAEVSVDGANSDPIPHIVDGIPVHLRDLRAYVDRPNFTLNPTSCAKKSTASTILGSGLDFVSPADDNPVTVSSPFQAADCASLGFKPALKLSLGGKKTHRGALPAFKAVLTYPKHGAYANIAKAQVTLPPSEILEQAHLEKVCPKSVFTTGQTPGENCPASSIYGTAKAWTPLLDEPLEGPVFLRTGYGTVLPELTATLNSKQIHIVLAGKIDSVQKKGTEISRIRNTFELVPDAPVSKFVLEMKGGNKGLLVNKTNICRGTHKAIAAFTAQNGKLREFEPVLKASGCAKKSKKGKK
jgi:hypothetical protein